MLSTKAPSEAGRTHARGAQFRYSASCHGTDLSRKGGMRRRGARPPARLKETSSRMVGAGGRRRGKDTGTGSCRRVGWTCTWLGCLSLVPCRRAGSARRPQSHRGLTKKERSAHPIRDRPLGGGGPVALEWAAHARRHRWSRLRRVYHCLHAHHHPPSSPTSCHPPTTCSVHRRGE